ncbi:MAG: NAD(P)(+) transhydrogenase (Re/Si-specific) subunit alpha, partial [Myxococcota bacterium]|nr:NAD(P)(+) transhydrogenase (Re/Si-specific) subunit alpha [Myxococcota bacterium]
MQVGVPRERFDGERRVAATPDTVKRLIKMGFDVVVETGAGARAQLPDDAYEAAGARIAVERADVWSSADVVLKVRPPTALDDGVHEADSLRKGQLLISLLFPAQNGPLVEQMSAKGASVVALDQIPRISRAQKMDVLSSMANIAGYRAVIEAANQFGSFFGGQITAAGKTRPAQVLVIGAGVAGLAAIAAARGLGAQVRAFDVRLAAKEQV